MPAPLVSVYIPCYNGARFIGRCIESLLRQTLRPDEIILIDDGSTDRTPQIAARYPIKVVPQGSNKGVGAARNRAFAEARNELVAGTDADCQARPDWLERLVACMTETHVAAAGGPAVETVLDTVPDRWRDAHMAMHWGPNQVRNPRYLFGCNTIMSKSAVVACGGYDERFKAGTEDPDICLRLQRHGYEFVYEPRAVVMHLRRDSLRTVFDAYWRYNCFARYEPICLRELIADTRFRLTGAWWRLWQKDWRRRNLDLLGLDLLFPLYMAYRNIRLYLDHVAYGKTFP